MEDLAKQAGAVQSDMKPQGSANDVINDINREFGEKKVMQKAQTSGTPYIDILIAPLNSDLVQSVDADACEKAVALPFFQLGKKMRVAVVDENNEATKAFLEDLRTKNYEVQIALASENGIKEKIAQIREMQPKKKEVFENEEAEKDLQTYEKEIEGLEQLGEKGKEMSAKAILNQILIGALRTGASDIHFQPSEKAIVVRFRIDGVLQKIITFDPKTGKSVSDQLKYESKLRLNVSNIPQDGRTSFQASGRKVDVRVSTLPTEYVSESIVCRLLDSGKKAVPLEELGFLGKTLENIKEALRLRSGMILSTGPTGSGKTTTLYTLLDNFNTKDRKVATLEDPVEYHLEGIVQSQVDENSGYSFADGLRALLRQDPDVLMVGEIRDNDTAETAAQAAMTGHIVLSTIHTNSAVEAIPRLVNLGLEPFMLASSLKLVIAQRLVRKPCEHCAKKIPPTENQRALMQSYLDEIKKNNSTVTTTVPEFIWETHECENCSHTGYKGQMVIAESFVFNAELSDLVAQADTSSAKITQYLREKQAMISFAEDGIVKVCEGLTTLSEIERVAGIKTSK